MSTVVEMELGRKLTHAMRIFKISQRQGCKQILACHMLTIETFKHLRALHPKTAIGHSLLKLFSGILGVSSKANPQAQSMALASGKITQSYGIEH